VSGFFLKSSASDPGYVPDYCRQPGLSQGPTVMTLHDVVDSIDALSNSD